jgi:beta-lactamase class D
MSQRRFEYYDRLSAGQRRIYRASDAIPAIAVPDADALQPLVRTLERTLTDGTRAIVRSRTFLRTLLHEVVHHLDFTLFALGESFHTQGFFRRESSLVRHGVALLTLVTCTAFGCRPQGTRSSLGESSTGTPGASCFLLYEVGVGERRRSPDEACGMRLTPASTFKIPHALAALDAGVLAGPDATLAYDGSLGATAPDIWKRDQTLATAMRYSVVWYFQKIATMLGAERENAYLARFDYGNRDASSGLTTFWLDESLRISPAEQEKFMVRLYEDALPVSREAMRAVRDILVQPPGVVVNALGAHPFDAPWPEGTVVSAKTGSSGTVTWLVGNVQRQGQSWVFVSCVTGSWDRDPLAAIRLAAVSLREAMVL